MGKVLRVVEPVVLTDEHGALVVPTAAELFDADDWLVKAYPWAFCADEDRVETATAAPGERRRGPGRPPKASLV